MVLRALITDREESLLRGPWLSETCRTPWLRLATRDAKTLPILLACHQTVFGIEGRALDDEIEVTEVALDSGGAPLDDSRLGDAPKARYSMETSRSLHPGSTRSSRPTCQARSSRAQRSR